MHTIHYYFDESGEKGYVGPSFTTSDIGLVAGIALPESSVPDFEEDVSRILSKLDSSQSNKLHATELFKNGANALVKAELLDFLANRNGWLLIFEAVYPLGIYQRESSNAATIEQHKPKNPRVRISKNKDRTRVYTELLEGVVVKLDEVCRIEGSSSIIMFSDRIDKGIFKEAEAKLEDLKQKTHTTTTSGFDTATGQIVRGSITSQVLGFDSSVHFVNEIRTEVTASTMTIIADVIANSLYRHLRVASQTTSAIALHAHAALNGYALKHRIAFIDDNYVMDRLYAPHG